ncbi:MAG: DNA-formamidopyrimidine glycosylase family protein [Solirubrobacterales bacterium]
MAEGDTILRAARAIEAALGGEALRVGAPNPRGRAAGVERLDGMTLEGVAARGKHLLLDFGGLVLHSHLGMSGSWRVGAPGASGGKGAPWAVLTGSRAEAAQRGGPTLRVLRSGRLAVDPVLSRLGPDLLASGFDPGRAAASLRRGGPARQVGDALLDQRLVAGIGNVFKSEGCFEAGLDPWMPLGELAEEDLTGVLSATRALMLAAVGGAGRPGRVYRRPGRRCPRCGATIASAPQGDEARTTYWCPGCQGRERASPPRTPPGPSPPHRR